MKDNKSKRNSKIEQIKLSLRKVDLISKNHQRVEAKEERIRVRKQSLIEADVTETVRLMRKYSDEDEEEDQSLTNSFESKYTFGEVIGEGGNAYVSKCFHKETGKLYAVKAMTMDDEHILGLKKNFIHIKELHCPGIIKYKALYFDLKKHVAYLVMELSPFKNLIQIGPQDEKVIS